MIKYLAKWWMNINQDPIEKWLASSHDLIELEHRQQQLKYRGKL